MGAEQTISNWMATAKVPSRPSLEENIKVDVGVVGAGIAGMTAAYLLASEGKKVAVLDDGPIVLPLWRAYFTFMDKKVQGFIMHPSGYIFPQQLAVPT